MVKRKMNISATVSASIESQNYKMVLVFNLSIIIKRFLPLSFSGKSITKFINISVQIRLCINKGFKKPCFSPHKRRNYERNVGYLKTYFGQNEFSNINVAVISRPKWSINKKSSFR